MRFRTYITVVAILAVLNGLSFLPVPEVSLRLFGVTTDEGGILLARYYGATALGTGVLLWLARHTDERQTQRALAVGIITVFVPALVVGVLGTLAGVMNGLGWLVVAIDTLVAVGATYFLLVIKE